MFDAADVLHGPTDPAIAAIATMAGFKTSDNATAVAASLALTASGFTSFFSGNSKQLGRAAYRNIQGFQPALSKTWDFTGDWVWQLTIGQGGAPGVVGGLNAGVISSSATVGDLSVFLQFAEDQAFTNPVDLDGIDIPLGAWVGSASYANGLAAGQYTQIRRALPKLPQPGVSTLPTWSASAIPSLKLLYDFGRTYAAGDPAWYNGYIYKAKDSNAGNLPNAAASTHWAPTVWVPQFVRAKFVVSNGATASNLTFFLPVVEIKPAKS